MKQEKAIGRKLTLVAQEIKAEQEPHYHDNEKQRKSDNVTDIHEGIILDLTNHPALSTVNVFGFLLRAALPSHQLGRSKLFGRVYGGEESD